MPVGLNFLSVEELHELFVDVADDWKLTAAERDAIRGVASTSGRSSPGDHSDFVVERMALVVQIDVLLGARMSREQVQEWLRTSVPGIFGSSPLEEMFGSTDRLRCIRALLAAEAAQ
jgi:hypothetical protein